VLAVGEGSEASALGGPLPISQRSCQGIGHRSPTMMPSAKLFSYQVRRRLQSRRRSR
jgi:hypothetical protein